MVLTPRIWQTLVPVLRPSLVSVVKRNKRSNFRHYRANRATKIVAAKSLKGENRGVFPTLRCRSPPFAGDLRGGIDVRVDYYEQLRFDCLPIESVVLNRELPRRDHPHFAGVAAHLRGCPLAGRVARARRSGCERRE